MGFSCRIGLGSPWKLAISIDKAFIFRLSSSLERLGDYSKWKRKCTQGPELCAKRLSSSHWYACLGSVIPSGTYELPKSNTFPHLGCRGPRNREQAKPRPTSVKPKGNQDPSPRGLQYCHHHHRKGLIKIHFFGWCFSHQHLITPGL